MHTVRARRVDGAAGGRAAPARPDQRALARADDAAARPGRGPAAGPLAARGDLAARGQGRPGRRLLGDDARRRRTAPLRRHHVGGDVLPRRPAGRGRRRGRQPLPGRARHRGRPRLGAPRQLGRADRVDAAPAGPVRRPPADRGRLRTALRVRAAGRGAGGDRRGGAGGGRAGDRAPGRDRARGRRGLGPARRGHGRSGAGRPRRVRRRPGAGRARGVADPEGRRAARRLRRRGRALPEQQRQARLRHGRGAGAAAGRRPGRARHRRAGQQQRPRPLGGDAARRAVRPDAGAGPDRADGGRGARPRHCRRCRRARPAGPRRPRARPVGRHRPARPVRSRASSRCCPTTTSPRTRSGRCPRSAVRDVWVGGRQVVRDGECLHDRRGRGVAGGCRPRRPGWRSDGAHRPGVDRARRGVGRRRPDPGPRGPGARAPAATCPRASPAARSPR